MAPQAECRKHKERPRALQHVHIADHASYFWHLSCIANGTSCSNSRQQFGFAHESTPRGTVWIAAAFDVEASGGAQVAACEEAPTFTEPLGLGTSGGNGGGCEKHMTMLLGA